MNSDEIDNTPHFFVEDVNPMVDTFGETSNINFANNAIKAAVTPLPEKILGAESVHNAKRGGKDAIS